MGIKDLFKPDYQSDDPDVRLKGIDKCSDQEILMQIAMTDSSPRVRMAAVQKVDEQALLRNIALDGEYIDARIAAVEKIESQEQLAEILKVRKNFQLMGACFARITDKKILERIANDTGYNMSARRIAIENYADESFLSEMKPAPGADSPVKSKQEIGELVKKYGGDRLVHAMSKFRGSKNAILALGEIMRQGGESALTALEQLAQSLGHASPAIKKTAGDQLATMTKGEHVSHLIRLSTQIDLHEKILAVLQRIDHPEARQFVEKNEP